MSVFMSEPDAGERFRALENALYAMKRAAEETGILEVMAKNNPAYSEVDGKAVAAGILGMEISVVFKKPLETKK